MIDETIIEEVISEMLSCFSGNREKFSETREIFSARMQGFIRAEWFNTQELAARGSLGAF